MASALAQRAWRGLVRARAAVAATSAPASSSSSSSAAAATEALHLPAASSRGLARGLSTASATSKPAAAVAAAASSSSPPSADGGEKHKTPRRIATSLLSALRRAEHAKELQANAEKAIPDFRPGDSVEVKMVTHLTSKEIDTYRGVVLGIRKNGADSRFTIADVILGTPLLSDIPLYSPFIKSIKVLGRAHIHKGKRRVRRSKLYYLWEKRDPKEFTITG